jgi:hypothetical protein
VRDAGAFSQIQFAAGTEWQRVELHHTVSVTTTHVKLALAPGLGHGEAEQGSFLADDIRLRLAGGQTNLLRNGSLEEAARWSELLIMAPMEERWQQFAPRLASAAALRANLSTRSGDYGLYVALLFPGFWGNFGWLQLPLPVGIYVVLAMACLAAGVGLISGRWRVARNRNDLGEIAPGTTLIDSWLLAVLVIAIQTLLPMLGREWQPQGRYLFPALFPITGVLLAGLSFWLGWDGWSRRAAGLIALLFVFAVTCLIFIIRAY